MLELVEAALLMDIDLLVSIKLASRIKITVY